MKLATVATSSGPRAAVVLSDRVVDLHAADPALPTSLEELLRQGLVPRTAEVASRSQAVVSQPRFLAPILRPQKIICVGLNYRDHAEESGAPIPREPVLFSKYPTAIIGPDEPIVLPAVSQQVDYEAELVIVVGKRGRHLSAENAADYVAGYTVGHDVSARDWQLQKDGKQWMVGKTFDTFAPIGPVIVTPDEIGDPHELGIRLRLNGQTMQSSNTKQMIFKVNEILAYLSLVFTLEPGDLIFTGTPPGVGFARKPAVFLKGGDVVEVEIDGIGTLRNPVVQG